MISERKRWPALPHRQNLVNNMLRRLEKTSRVKDGHA